jgi:hypothetical protein
VLTRPPHCPNSACSNHQGGKDWFIKKGYFKTKWNAQPVPRYQVPVEATNLTLFIERLGFANAAFHIGCLSGTI